MLIITGDHGEALFDRDVVGHGQNYLFDEVLRVPLIVHHPELEHKRMQQPFSLKWLHELISEVTHLPNFNMPNSNQKTHVGNNDPEPVVISDSINKYGHTVAIRNKKYKYIIYEQVNGKQTPSHFIGPIDDEVLFQINGDPGESRLLDPNHAPDLRRQARRFITMPDELQTLDDSLN